MCHRASRQAIVLSHEDATPQCTIPYLGCRLRSLPVLEVLGRSAKREPKCLPSHAVFYWWKDLSRAPQCRVMKSTNNIPPSTRLVSGSACAVRSRCSPRSGHAVRCGRVRQASLPERLQPGGSAMAVGVEGGAEGGGVSGSVPRCRGGEGPCDHRCGKRCSARRRTRRA